MQVIIKGSAKEIAALVQKLQERQHIIPPDDLSGDNLGIKLCSDDVLEHQ